MQGGHTVRQSGVQRPERKARLNPCEPRWCWDTGAWPLSVGDRAEWDAEQHTWPPDSAPGAPPVMTTTDVLGLRQTPLGTESPQVTHPGSKAPTDSRRPSPFKYKHRVGRERR